MRISILDTGIRENQVISDYKMIHFVLKGNILEEGYVCPIDEHGTNCFKEIISQINGLKPEILDMNIMNNNGNISEDSIILAIKKSIEERVDVINISLGVQRPSKELYEVCNEAVKNNIVIFSASAHNNTISFPADFDNVICVKVNHEQTNEIEVHSHMTITVSMKDFIISENGQQYDFSSSSMACARACGIISKELFKNSLDDKYKLLRKKWGIEPYIHKNNQKCDEVTDSKMSDYINNNRVAVVTFPENRIRDIDPLYLKNNIIAYYSEKDKKFIDIRDNTETTNFDSILVINTAYEPMEYPKYIKEKYPNYEVVCAGEYHDHESFGLFLNYSDYGKEELAQLENPIIAIMGVCSGLNKLDIEKQTYSFMKEDGFDIKIISNNPLGIIYGADVFEYPNNIKFPDIVYSINRYMYTIETTNNFDAWIINVGGGISQINNMNTYNFGKLVDAYLSAANIDIGVFCIPPSINIEYVNNYITYMHRYGVKKTFVVLSHNDIDPTTMDYRNGLQTYVVDKTKYADSFQKLKVELGDELFSWEDMENGNLYKAIIDSLS